MCTRIFGYSIFNFLMLIVEIIKIILIIILAFKIIKTIKTNNKKIDIKKLIKYIILLLFVIFLFKDIMAYLLHLIAVLFDINIWCSVY